MPGVQRGGGDRAARCARCSRSTTPREARDRRGQRRLDRRHAAEISAVAAARTAASRSSTSPRTAASARRWPPASARPTPRSSPSSTPTASSSRTRCASSCRASPTRRSAPICGHADVLNLRETWLTRMQAVRYFVAFKVVKAAESVFNAVTCCSGCFSAYRREAILPHLDWWENQTLPRRRQSTFGDDRSLTNCVLRDWKVRYEATAVSHTIVPDDASAVHEAADALEALLDARVADRRRRSSGASTRSPRSATYVGDRAAAGRPDRRAPRARLAAAHPRRRRAARLPRSASTRWPWSTGSTTRCASGATTRSGSSAIVFVFFYLAFLLWQTYYAILTSRSAVLGHAAPPSRPRWRHEAPVRAQAPRDLGVRPAPPAALDRPDRADGAGPGRVARLLQAPVAQPRPVAAPAVAAHRRAARDVRRRCRRSAARCRCSRTTASTRRSTARTRSRRARSPSRWRCSGRPASTRSRPTQYARFPGGSAKDLPSRPILITFDDGRLDTLPLRRPDPPAATASGRRCS